LERLARIGWLAGEVALGGAAEGVRRLVGTGGGPSENVFLTGPNGRRLARRLSTMRGAAMKLGQMLSMEGEDLIPKEVAQALSVLRSDGDAMPQSQLRRVLGRAWGRGWEERLREFDFEPIAAASIGQVHRAVTAGGETLAVKIQYPGVAASTESDVDNLAAALRFSGLIPRGVDISGLVAEAKRELRRESDYELEARNLERYRELIGDDPRFAAPTLHAALTTSRVLAMSHVPGLPLEDLCGPEHSQERRDVTASTLLELVLRELFEFRFVQTDPNLANYLWMPESEQIGLLDFGAAREIPESIASGYASLCLAVTRNDRPALRRAVMRLGLVDGRVPAADVDALLDFIELACEPFHHRGAYDFGASDLPARARAAAARLALRRELRGPPPTDILFVQRKIGGSFLTCARLRARVDVRGLLEEAIGRGALASDCPAVAAGA
jgi:predicted unusual protein kinase regulating ubiquinone biosynthesis (AarF/ABC1/UbiB family)